MEEIHKTLRRFGCAQFGSMMDEENGNLIVQFQFRGTPVSIKASINGYAAAWLKETPYSHRMKRNRQEHEQEAKRIASLAVYSILRDWIKGQITAIETGILSFEGAFLGQILLPSGKTVLETAKAQKMLPAPTDEKIVELGSRK
jgi:hypothetical protein